MAKSDIRSQGKLQIGKNVICDENTHDVINISNISRKSLAMKTKTKL